MSYTYVYISQVEGHTQQGTSINVKAKMHRCSRYGFSPALCLSLKWGCIYSESI